MLFTSLLCGTQAGSTPILENHHCQQPRLRELPCGSGCCLNFIHQVSQEKGRKKERRRDTGEPGIFHRKFLEVATAHFCFRFIGQNTVIWPYLRSKARNCGFFSPKQQWDSSESEFLLQRKRITSRLCYTLSIWEGQSNLPTWYIETWKMIRNHFADLQLCSHEAVSLPPLPVFTNPWVCRDVWHLLTDCSRLCTDSHCLRSTPKAFPEEEQS